MSPNPKKVAEAPSAPPSPNPRGLPKPSSKRRKPPARGTLTPRSADEVREEKLERAKRLLQDANYPSEEVIESVANLLARGWRKSQGGPTASIESRDPGTN